MSTGIIGIVDYLGFFLPHLGSLAKHLIGIGFTIAVVAALYRRIESIRAITTVLWLVMLAAAGFTIAAAYSGFHSHLAFTYPGGFGTGLLGGLGAGLIIAIYDYLGYYTVAEMGDEVKDPGRVIPRSIIVSIGAMMAIYLVLNIGVVGTMPWQQVAKSSSVASSVVTRNWGRGAADVVTVLIIITAFASVFAGLLGGSHLPYNAARDQVFFRVFGRLHRRYDFPHIALLAMGLITAIGSFFDLTTVINLLLATAVLVQSVAQILALTVLRRRQPELHRPTGNGCTRYPACSRSPAGSTCMSRRPPPRWSAPRCGSWPALSPTSRGLGSTATGRLPSQRSGRPISTSSEMLPWRP